MVVVKSVADLPHNKHTHTHTHTHLFDEGRVWSANHGTSNRYQEVFVGALNYGVYSSNGHRPLVVVVVAVVVGLACRVQIRSESTKSTQTRRRNEATTAVVGGRQSERQRAKQVQGGGGSISSSSSSSSSRELHAPSVLPI